MQEVSGIERRRFLVAAAALGAGTAYLGLTGQAAQATGRTAPRRRVGGLEVVALVDASGPFFIEPALAFPQATAADWQAAQRIDPGAFGRDGSWVLDFRCYAIRRPGGRCTLVDAGVGPKGSPANWAPQPGHLPEVLDREGIHTVDVDTVVLTHLHEDHLGWSVLPDGTPMFPNARYLVQQADVTALAESGDVVLTNYVVNPLRRTGQLQVVDGEVCLTRHGGRTTIVPTPGHTPGHQSVLVEGGDETVVITGDVLVHAVQLADPTVGYRYESDQDVARQTRQALLDRAVAERALLATAHLRQPFIRPPDHRHPALG
jgi:glyoxylase-like metal-dependent hydrolase (beta-lactamase superfamily II)